MAKNRIFNEADLPLEVAILLLAGLMMLITGILLFQCRQERFLIMKWVVRIAPVHLCIANSDIGENSLW